MDRSAHESSLLPSFFRFRSMSFFERSSDLHVYGGNFYAVAGDMNIERPVEDSWTSPSDVRVLGAQRNKPESARYTPYNALTRPWGQSNAPSSSRREEHAETSLTSGTSPTTESWFTTFDYTSLPEYFPEPHPSETTVSLYPGEEQFLSLISPQAISINPDFHTLNHTISCPPTDLRPLRIVQRGNELPSQRTEGCSEQFGIYLPDKYTTTIHGGTFVSQTRPGEKGIDKLHNVAALEALHDSADSFPQPRCHPETRTKMLEDLQEWSQETDPTSSILWLFGPAGAGKSAIMRTLSSQLQDTGRLGGCFFFKRGHPTRGNAKALFVTIAYQLALDIPWLKGPISQVVERNPSILARSIEIQLQKLISEPCRMQPDRNPLTILIDGLDECEGQNVHLEILRAIRNSFTEHFLPLRFIIASRPEAHIREMFESSFYDGVHRPFNVERSFDDVRTFFLDEFERIHHEHRQTMATVSLPWPHPDVLRELVRKSSGHFIYASTVIKFIDDKNYRPAERLVIVMKDQTESDSAFEALDQLYINILSTAPIAKQPQLIPMLCAIVNFDLGPSYLDGLLGLEKGDSRLFLRGLHSVIEVPTEEQEKEHSRISAHHASFFDFLNDPKRSQNFYVNRLPARMDLVHSFLRLQQARGLQEFHPWYYQYWDYPSRSYILAEGPRLPPSVELLSLFESKLRESRGSHKMWLTWMRKIHPTPEDVIQLWEDYEYFTFIDDKASQVQSYCSTKMIKASAHCILSHSRGLLQFLRIILLTNKECFLSIDFYCLLLDVSWIELGSILSYLRSIIGKDEEMFGNLLYHLRSTSFAGEKFPWPSVCRDLARRIICIGKDITAGKLNDMDRCFPCDAKWAFLVRLSPHCNELLRDIRNLHPLSQIECYPDDIYSVLKWLETFPDPPVEVIARWRQYLDDSQIPDNEEDSYLTRFVVDEAEEEWNDYLNWIQR